MERVYDKEALSARVLGQEAYHAPLQDKKAVRAFFRLLWFDLNLDFNPDDDFAGYGVFTDEAAALLNARMDEAFRLMGDNVHDEALRVMQEEPPKA